MPPKPKPAITLAQAQAKAAAARAKSTTTNNTTPIITLDTCITFLDQFLDDDGFVDYTILPKALSTDENAKLLLFSLGNSVLRLNGLIILQSALSELQKQRPNTPGLSIPPELIRVYSSGLLQALFNIIHRTRNASSMDTTREIQFVFESFLDVSWPTLPSSHDCQYSQQFIRLCESTATSDSLLWWFKNGNAQLKSKIVVLITGQNYEPWIKLGFFNYATFSPVLVDLLNDLRVIKARLDGLTQKLIDVIYHAVQMKRCGEMGPNPS